MVEYFSSPLYKCVNCPAQTICAEGDTKRQKQGLDRIEINSEGCKDSIRIFRGESDDKELR